MAPPPVDFDYFFPRAACVFRYVVKVPPLPLVVPSRLRHFIVHSSGQTLSSSVVQGKDGGCTKDRRAHATLKAAASASRDAAKIALSASLGAIGHLLIRQPYIPALAGIAGSLFRPAAFTL